MLREGASTATTTTSVVGSENCMKEIYPFHNIEYRILIPICQYHGIFATMSQYHTHTHFRDTQKTCFIPTIQPNRVFHTILKMNAVNSFKILSLTLLLLLLSKNFLPLLADVCAYEISVNKTRCEQIEFHSFHVIICLFH